jgi:hypothetical protein
MGVTNSQAYARQHVNEHVHSSGSRITGFVAIYGPEPSCLLLEFRADQTRPNTSTLLIDAAQT